MRNGVGADDVADARATRAASWRRKEVRHPKPLSLLRRRWANLRVYRATGWRDAERATRLRPASRSASAWLRPHDRGAGARRRGAATNGTSRAARGAPAVPEAAAAGVGAGAVARSARPGREP